MSFSTITTASWICLSAGLWITEARRTVTAAKTSWAAHYYCIPRFFKPTASFLYHNNGDGTFREIREGTDIARSLGKGLGVVATDINNDGLMDLFVANDTVQKPQEREPSATWPTPTKWPRRRAC